ncbi:hypothetical protein [Pseudomonas syringae group genomosp. 7]|uniref:hypothetical protein n=1 Tax=Pseudomonas syringae group genomosp. 7 TaxID=251699 RepID=UPI00376FC9A7
MGVLVCVVGFCVLWSGFGCVLVGALDGVVLLVWFVVLLMVVVGVGLSGAVLVSSVVVDLAAEALS